MIGSKKGVNKLLSLEILHTLIATTVFCLLSMKIMRVNGYSTDLDFLIVCDD